jgi:heme a synthase
MVWLNRFITFVAASTILLIAAGGMVTSTGSGLAVPDWPHTYGEFMFSFPYEKWVGGIFYEHGHRLIASTVGFLTIILAVWTWWVEPRRWVRRLGFIALGAVIVQGVLGGLTVIYLLPAPISIGHAGLAQLFFCLMLALAVFTSKSWREQRSTPDDPMLRRVAVATAVFVFLQILVGATMRHTGAGLAIPDFPLAFGGLLPPAWNVPVAVHFAHRVGAVIVFAAILATWGHIQYHHRSRGELMRPAVLLVVLVLLQGVLGAFVVWTGLQPIVNTLHVVNGALVFGTSVVLALRTFRPVMDQAPARDDRGMAPVAAPLGARP